MREREQKPFSTSDLPISQPPALPISRPPVHSSTGASLALSADPNLCRARTDPGDASERRAARFRYARCHEGGSGVGD